AELHALGLVDDDGLTKLDAALAQVAEEAADDSFAWDDAHEDVHMNAEVAVRAAVGPELAGQLQAGRSRNEEIVTDERLWLLAAARRIDSLLLGLLRTLVERADAELETPVPAHTHTQPAQPTLLAHHLHAHAEALG